MGKFRADLSSKVALVTGGSKGIGEAIAVALAENGARVVINYLSSKARADDLVHRHENIVMAIPADVSDPAAVERLVGQVQTDLGGVDILVNNAGSQVAQMRMDAMTVEFWNQVMNLNLTATMVACRCAIPTMREKRWGRIVNISSISARSGGGPGGIAYATSKGGMSTFTRGLAKEVAPFGITVNSIDPGVILTELHEKFNTPENLENLRKMTPLGRLGVPADCAGAAVFLASDSASYITGAAIAVNGGLRMD